MGCCGGNSKMEVPGYVDECGSSRHDDYDNQMREMSLVACRNVSSKKVVSMSLARALTYKKRVAERLKQVDTDIIAYNSVLAGQDREVDVNALFEERSRLVSHMVHLKLAIQQANGPIQRDILVLAELKSENDFYRRVPTLHGVRQNQFAYDPGQSATLTYDAVVRKSDADAAVKQNNAMIDSTQERIEAHNHTAQITVEDIGLFS